MRVPYVLLLLLLLGAALLRLPAFFQPAWYGDEGIFAAVADEWRHGATLYAGVWDNKPPGIYLVYAASWSAGLEMLGVRLLDLGAMAGVMLLVFAIGRRQAGDTAGVIAAGAAGLLLGLPTLEGHIANTESFMIVFTTAGMLLLLGGLEPARDRPWLLALPGAVLGGALLFKQVGLLDAAAAGAFVALYYRASWRHLGALMLGGAAPALFTGALFAAAGAFPAFWQGNVGFMLEYRDGGLSQAQLAALLLPIALALPYAVATRPWQTGSTDGLLPLWLAFAVVGVAAGGNAYPHYMLQAVPPFALVLATSSRATPIALPRASVAAGMVTAGLLVYHVFLGPWGYVGWNEEPDYTREYYRNFVDYATGNRSREDYLAFFDANTPGRIELIEAMRDLDLQSRDVFVWGNLAWIYPEARLHSPTPYTVLFLARWLEGDPPDVARMLLDARPSYILVLDEARDEWREAEPLLSRVYEYAGRLEGAALLRYTGIREAPTVLQEQSCYAGCDD